MMWTWIGGSSSFSAVGIYGVKGEAAANSRPGARSGHSMVIDSEKQVMMVFGGYGFGRDTANMGMPLPIQSPSCSTTFTRLSERFMAVQHSL